MSSVADAMVEHGIATTAADYWVHLFPLEQTLFWYRVDHCREFIALHSLPITIGRSKDGEETGAGYVIAQNSYFISAVSVPAKYLHHADWVALTDRQSGFMGEHVISVLLEHRVFTVPPLRGYAQRGKQMQNSSVDLATKYFGPLAFEFKTERRRTGNLYVQSRERGHRVHLANENGELITRVTDAPPFTR